MTLNETFNPASLVRSVGVAAIAGLLALAIAAPSEAQRRRDNDEEQVEGRVLTSAVGEQVLAAQECQEADDINCVLQIMNELAGRDNLSPYERFVVLQLRARAYFQEDRLDLAIRDFQGALDTGVTTTDETVSLRTALGQLYLVQENVDQAIRQFELAIQAGAELTPSFAKTVAQAYLQAERLADGVRYAEIFYNNTPDKTEQDFNLMFYFYQQLDRTSDQLRVIREYLSAYPGARQAWQNLIALYAQQDNASMAFEANKLMYLNGLFQEENELIRLVQYYSFFENPFRGASILQREMNAGRVEVDQDNLELLANMWRQASEFERAIPVLERLSELQGSGETALRLAEANFSLNNFAAAEDAFQTAIDRGGLSDTGKAWELLGTSRFRQGNRQGALNAFREGARYPSTRSSSNGWIRWITAQIEGEERRRVQQEQIVIDECRLTLEAERRQIVLTGSVDDEGRVRFESIPERCEPYYNIYGEQIREAGMTDAEAEEAQAQREADAAAAEG
ncbi:lipopolysaccharide assembly protein LapB [Oceanicaulis sp. MMSF_3324]|uniref:tetratricopeptide repeat protein n=1 Tax=Oceanicaulis sp. MMSF_3324 TaxID=3046702 RepID=UPI00273FBDAD|nr:tetratricopeptide repeat protein [Oceanicaulis sp. MMSF_3324]